MTNDFNYNIRRLNVLFYYVKYVNASSSRKRKHCICKMFDWWFMMPSNGEYYQEFWKMQLQDKTFVRKFLMKNCKALYNNQFGNMIKLMEIHKNLNLPNNK